MRPVVLLVIAALMAFCTMIVVALSLFEGRLAQTHAYGCGVIAGQQKMMGKWDEDGDCRSIRERAVRDGLDAVADWGMRK